MFSKNTKGDDKDKKEDVVPERKLSFFDKIKGKKKGNKEDKTVKSPNKEGKKKKNKDNK